MMSKQKVGILNKFLEPVVNIISPSIDCINLWDKNEINNESFKEIKGLVSSVWDKVDADLMALFPHLKIISHMGVGVDAIDVRTAKVRQVIVTNTPDVVTDVTADLAMGLLLTLARKIVIYDRYVKAGAWEKRHPHPLSMSLKNKKIGIVGLGKIGNEIAKRAEAFKLKVFYWGKNKKNHVHYEFVNELVELAQIADFLVVCCSGNDETKGIIDYKIFEALGKNAFLINISRGFVVNEQDLVLALENQLIAGAGLDVYENEPFVPKKLLTMENVVLQPHVGTATSEVRNEMYNIVASNILTYFKNGTTVTTPV